MEMLTTNNEGFQAMTVKNMLWNNVVTNVLDNKEPLILATSTKRLCSCENKHIGKGSEDGDSKSKAATTPHIAFTKRLTQCNIVHTTIESKLCKKADMPTFATIIQQLRSSLFILVTSTRCVVSCRSKHIGTDSNSNSQAGRCLFISTTKCLRNRQSR